MSKDVEHQKLLSAGGGDEKLGGLILEVATHPNDDLFHRSLAESGAVDEVVANKKCYLWVVYQANDPLLKMFREQMGNALRTYPAKATLHAHALRDGRDLTIPIEVVGVLHRMRTDPCNLPATTTSSAK